MGLRKGGKGGKGGDPSSPGAWQFISPKPCLSSRLSSLKAGTQFCSLCPLVTESLANTGHLKAAILISKLVINAEYLKHI